MAESSTSARYKNVLVCFKENKRPISFLPNDDVNEERQSFFEAFKVAYRDIFKDSTICPSDMQIQMKSEDWGGEFVDINDETVICDRDVVRIILKVSVRRRIDHT